MNTRISNAEPAELLCPHCGQSHLATYTHCPNTGKALHVGRAMIGRVIADCYRVVGLLGEGGMGAVYVADHLRIGRKVAIKRLHPELAADQKAVQRFQREARAAAATGHEHIVEIIDLGYTEDGAPYLVMEYLRGVTLAQLLKLEGRLTLRRASHIVGQLLAALAAVHEKTIVHRDLKPDNIFLTRRGADPDYVKVLDFGISKMKSEDDALELTRTGVMMGTPYYMSPEQARGIKTLDHRVDLYAAGIILFECLTGRVPFAGDNYHALLQQILRMPPPRASDITPGVPREVDDIIARALAKEATSRFPDATNMLESLLPHGAVRPVPRTADSLPRFSESDPTTSDVRLRADGFAMTEAVDIGKSDALDAFREPTAPRSRNPGLSASPRAEAPARAEPSSPRVEPSSPRIDARVEPRASVRPVPPRVETPRGEPAESGAPITRQRPALPPITPLPPGEPKGRYFFAASDDWNREAGRSIVPLGHRMTPAAVMARDPGTALREAFRDARAGREATGPFVPHNAAAQPAPAVMAVRESIAAPVDEATRRAAAEATVKGVIVAAALDHVRAVHGGVKLDAVLGRIEVAQRSKLSGVILPMAWVPLGAFEQLLRVAEEVVGAEGAVAESIGRACADRELPTTHRLFMQSATPSTAVERMPLLFRAYFGRGDARVAMSGVNGARVTFEHAGFDVPSTTFLLGFVHRLLEQSGGRDVRVTRGDDRTSLALRWR